MMLRLALLLTLALGCGGAKAQDCPTRGQQSRPRRQMVEMRAKDFRLCVEVANTDMERSKGLMFRSNLERDEGMLFVFPDEQMRYFWMKNTFLPLSIAYADSQGRIVSIKDMKPHDRTLVSSEQKARFALEVLQGRFAEIGVQVGDLLELPQGWAEGEPPALAPNAPAPVAPAPGSR